MGHTLISSWVFLANRPLQPSRPTSSIVPDRLGSTREEVVLAQYEDSWFTVILQIAV